MIPSVNPVAERLYARLDPVAYADEQYDWALLHWLDAWTGGMAWLDGIVRDEGADPGWSKLLDVDRAPDEVLDYLAQFIGLTFPGGTDAAIKRAALVDGQGLRRGSPSALISAAKEVLTGEKRVVLLERNGGAYKFTLATHADETPETDWKQVENIVTNPSSEVSPSFGSGSTSSPGEPASVIARSTNWAAAGNYSTYYEVTRDDDSRCGLLTGSALNQGTGGRFPVTPGHYYAARVKFKLDATCGPLTEAGMTMMWVQADNSTLSSVKAVANGPSVTGLVVNGVYDAVVIGKAPSDAAFLELAAAFTPDSSGGVVKVAVYVDALAVFDLGSDFSGPVEELTAKSDVPEYFDGSSIGCEWTGATNASTSRTKITNFVRDAALKQKPAGLVMEVIVLTGKTYDDVLGTHLTYDELVTDFATYNELLANPAHT